MNTLRSSRLRYIVVALIAALSAPIAHANSPVLSFPLPNGGQRGTEVPVTLIGQRIGDVEQVVFYEAGITVSGLEKIDANKAKAVFTIAADCRLGEHPVRLRTKYGWSTLHTFWVGPFPTVEEKEPNSDFETPQPIAINSTVAGVVENEDVDYFTVELEKGQRLSVEVEGVRLGIGGVNQVFDPYVAILDSKRFELDAADDTALLKQDGYASIIAPEDGTYTVLIRESAYGGNGNCRYRLHVGGFPRPTGLFPLGGSPGETVKFTFLGDKSGPIEMEATLPSAGRTEMPLFAKLGETIAPSPIKVRVAAMPNVTESEPNNDRETATVYASEMPAAFNGVIGSDGDMDFFRFTAKKGQSIEFRVFARGYGSKLDPVINIFSVDGPHLGGNDDAGNDPDPVHVQKFEADGEYVVRMRDHLYRGGADFSYRIEAANPTPQLSITMPDVARYDDQNRQFVSVPRGNRWMILMQANRKYFGGPIDLACLDLPPGVTMHAPRMPANVSHIPVVFEAAPDAPIEGKLCDLTARHADDANITGRWNQTTALVRGDPNGTPYYNVTVDRLPVAVTEEAPFSVSIQQPKVPLLQNGQMNLRIVAQRKEGFDEPINVQLPFRPPGFGAQYQVQIPKGQSEVYYPVSAAGNATIGKWPMAALAFAGVDGGNLFVASPHIELEIAAPLTNGQIALAVTEQGQPVDVIVSLEHVTPFEGEATLNLVGLPPKCEAQPLTIKAGQEQAVFKVTTDKETPVGQHKSLFCQVVLTREGEAMLNTLAGGGTLRVDQPKPAVVAQAPPKAEEKKADEKPKEAPKKVLSRLEQLRLEQQGAGQ